MSTHKPAAPHARLVIVASSGRLFPLVRYVTKASLPLSLAQKHVRIAQQALSLWTQAPPHAKLASQESTGEARKSHLVSIVTKGATVSFLARPFATNAKAARLLPSKHKQSVLIAMLENTPCRHRPLAQHAPTKPSPLAQELRLSRSAFVAHPINLPCLEEFVWLAPLVPPVMAVVRE